MKKTLCSFVLFGIFTLLIPVVKAEIVLTDKEANFVKTVYSAEYLNNITEEQKERIKELNLDINEVETKIIVEEDNPLTRGQKTETNSKQLSITKSCNTNACSIIVIVRWLTSPVTRSYDVMGARFTGTIAPYKYQNGVTIIETDTGDSTCVNYQNLSNGFGCSFKLSSSASTFYISQTFDVTGSGTVYASYQHASTAATLAVSKQYTLAYSGYGRVFDFYGTARTAYDQMNGVDITI